LREGEVADPLVSRVSAGIVFQDRQLLVERTDRPPGFRFVGEIDISNSVAISHALTQVLDGQPHIHLDMRSLVFCDVSGIRALVNVGQVLGPHRRLLLHGLAPELERVIKLVGWADEPGLSFCGCTEVGP
jgi:anti-anti-sigma factor